MTKWNSEFFADLAERVGATFLGALLGVITLTATTPVDWTDYQALWAVLGVPTLASLIKGLLANMANAESGASALPSPPGPEVNEEYQGKHERDEVGAVDWMRVASACVLIAILAVFVAALA